MLSSSAAEPASSCVGVCHSATEALIAAALFVFNFATFPEPPARAGLVDEGQLVGLTYLAVTIQVLRSLGWVLEKERLRTAAG